MSKNITIKEFNTSKTLNSIKYVITQKREGGSDDWVNEDDVKLTEKVITQRGTYKASDDGYYGYSKVTIRMPNSENAEDDDDDRKKYKAVTPSVTIQEGQLGKTFSSIKKLRIKETNGNYSLWVPEQNVPLGFTTIRGNGTFKAKDYGLYGFSKVTVTQKSTTIHKDDGNDYAEFPDGSEVKLPSSIDITTPPSVVTYNDGALISIDGIVVEAFYGDGGSWGLVPFEELTFDPANANASLVPEGSGSVMEDTTGLHESTIQQMPIWYTTLGAVSTLNIYWDGDEGDYDDENGYWGGGGDGEPLFEGIWSSSPVYVFGQKAYDGEQYTFYACSKEPFDFYYYSHNHWGTYRYHVVSYNGSGEQPVCSAIITNTNYGTHVDTNIPIQIEVKLPYEPVYISEWMKVILYGTQIAGGQEITVSWARPEDSQELTDTYNINVTGSIENNSGGGSGGSSGGSW